jgi:hypothetical protein
LRMVSRKTGSARFRTFQYWNLDGSHLRSDDDNQLPLCSEQPLPSWVARWEHHNTRDTLARGNASGDWNGPFQISTSQQQRKLTIDIHGISLTRIRVRLTPFTYNLNHHLQLPQLRHLESAIKVALVHMSPNPDILHALCCTLVGDSVWTISPNDSVLVFIALWKLITATIESLERVDNQSVKLMALIPLLRLPDRVQNHVKTLINNSCVRGRSICLADENRICLAPPCSQDGDIVVLFRGGPDVYVVRPKDDKFQVVGNGTMYGFMNGEALQQPDWDEKVKIFSLI